MLTVDYVPATPNSFRLSSGGFDTISSRLSVFRCFFVPATKVRRVAGLGSSRRKNLRVRASAAEKSSSGLGPVKPNGKPQRYHPFEDISDLEFVENGEARLTPAETSRTVIEVNCKATLMFSGLVSDEVHENIFWPDLPYVTDEYGNIYFQVKNDEDILQILTTEDNLVQVIIGLDTTELIREMESLGQAEIDFGVEEIDGDSDADEDDEEGEEYDDEGEDDDNEADDKDWIAILDDQEDEDSSDESLGDWGSFEKMRSSHPMYFAKKLVEVVSNDPVDFLEQPPAGLIVQGLLRPAFIEEQSVIQKHISDNQSSKISEVSDGNCMEDDEENPSIINNHKHNTESSQLDPDDDLVMNESLGSGTSFYKLEMIKVQLISAHGHQSSVEVEEVRRAQPDAIAHSAAKIISRLKAGGEKTMQALKALCYRIKSIQADEVALIGVDSRGFDLRVCSGTQVQTLRFGFKKQASSEYSAGRQLNDLLFPRVHSKPQQKKGALENFDDVKDDKLSGSPS